MIGKGARKLKAWGTFCPKCLTVRTSSGSIVCHGGDRAAYRHKPIVIVVLDVFK